MMSMMAVVIPVSSVVVMVAGRCLQIFRLISGVGWSGSLYGDFPPARTERQHETEGEDGLDLHDDWTAGLVVGQCEETRTAQTLYIDSWSDEAPSSYQSGPLEVRDQVRDSDVADTLRYVLIAPAW